MSKENARSAGDEALPREVPAGWMPDAKEAAKDRLFVTALARGLEILRAFRRGDDASVLGNFDIARRTRLPPSTVSRLTHTLVRLGYLERVPRLDKYRLGPAVLSLGYAFLADLDIARAARPLMEELAAHARVNVGLGAADRLDMVYVDAARGTGSSLHPLEPGSRIPMATTAMGQALLSQLPDGERSFLLDRMREQSPHDDWSRLSNAIAQASEEVRRQGFCVARWQPDIIAAGVPLLAGHGKARYALNCGGPTFMIDPQRLAGEFAPRLVSIARQVERKLGYDRE